MNELEKEIYERLYRYEHPLRIAWSQKHPILKKPLIFLRQQVRNFLNFFDYRISVEKQNIFFDHILTRHQSILRRKLGSSDPRLQEQKITNLKQAIKLLNGVIIRPNKIFSLWQIIGKLSYKNGYVDGMLLSNGKIIEGLGGGLCQLSNFLCWIFLHAPTKTIERYHHSMDVFPDYERTLPFGGGATILYNFIDLKIKNISPHPLQLKIWLTNNHLKGQILSPKQVPEKFHVFEKNHCFIKTKNNYFRFNEIYRETKVNGQIKNIEKIATNFAPVLYEITPEYLAKNNFTVLDSTYLYDDL